jgi:serine/threonine protein kinase/Flp pilus assembly protein TadD
MNEPERQIMSIFGEAVEHSSPEERAAFLAKACAGDAGRRARVEALLRAYEAAGNFLQGNPPPSEAVATVDQPPVVEGAGTVIGPYKLLEQIGEGGFGIVFMAEQQEPIRRKVALKVLKPGMDSKQVIARFEAERQALALMDHPHIAKVLDAGQTGSGRPYFVMELVKGVPITQFCDDHRLTPRERLGLFVDVCQAVQHAHQKGVIHRDIKPSNVLVTSHDGTPVVKVIDFGIAKAVGQQLTDKTVHTQFAQLIGTPLYMAPEQAGESSLDVDTRSDIYSLGVLLYELLTGTTPFDKERLSQVGYDELRRIIREEEPSKPSTRISTLALAASTASANRKSDPKQLSRLFRGELDWIVMKALEKDRNRRYESASAFAADVRRYLDDEPVLACPPSAWYRFRKFGRRHRAALALAFAALLVVAAVAGGVGWVVRDQESRRAVAQHEAGSALEDARRLQRQGQWSEALEAVKRAEGLLASVGGLEDLRRQVAQARADVDTVAQLEKARLRNADVRDGQFDDEAAERLYLAAFRSYGLDLATLDLHEAAARIGKSAVRDHLVAALDHWAYTVKPRTDKAGQRRLLAIGQLADGDVWRRRFRDLDPSRDRTDLERWATRQEVMGQPPATLLVLGLALRAAGARGAAVELLRQAQRQHPDDFWINHNLGRALSDPPAHPAEAVGYLRAALALRPGSAGVHNNLAFALRLQGRHDEAIAHYGKACKLDARAPFLFCNLGHVLRIRNRLPEVEVAYRQAIAIQPDLSAAYASLAAILNDLHRYPEAADCCRKAIELDKNSALAHYNLGNVLRGLGRHREAAAAYRRAIDLDPKHAEAHCNLGNTLRDQREVPKAVEAYRKAIALNPDLAEAHNNLGLLLRDLGKLEEAEVSFRKAIAVKPDYAEAHCNLGGVLRRQRRFTESLAEIRRGHALGTRRADWRYPSAKWVRDGEILAALDDKLAAIQRGTAQPADAAERFTLAEFCVMHKRLPVRAALFCTEAFAAAPPLTAPKKAVHLYNAACAAALAGNGRGEDAAKLDDKERARWRRQALDWLRLALAVWTERAEKGAAAERGTIFARMHHWQRDADLSGIREEVALTKFPDAERQTWRKFWADVEALRSRLKANGKKPPPKNP